MKTIFKKRRDFFSHNKPIYKNLFQFIHRCHIFGEPNPSLSPNFQQFCQIFGVKDDLSSLQAAFLTSSISPWRFDVDVEDFSAPDRNILNLPHSESEEEEGQEVDLTKQVAVEHEDFPSLTPREGQDEPKVENSSRKPSSQRINQILGQIHEL